ncbi:MAG: ankyrin repeat domain-containing protein [Bacteroidota bacterium]
MMRFKFPIRLLIYLLIIMPGLNYAGAQIIIDLNSGDTTRMIHYKQQYDSALLDATIMQQSDSLLELLNSGANPDAASSEGITALMYASEAGNTEIMKILILNGAGIETTFFEGATPLLFAIRNNQFDACQLLLEKGANPDVRDHFGISPLLYAAAQNSYQLSDLLIYFGADKEIADRDGNSALMTAVCLGNIETADVLLQNGLNPEHADKNGNTPLIVAAQYGDTAMIRLLADYGADINAVNKTGDSPLSAAVKYNFPDAARLLIEKGADTGYKINAFRNIYDLARESGCKDCLQTLDSMGARPLPMPDFSEIDLIWGNSFGTNEYIMHTRLSLVDKKFGFFFETGFDFRPSAQKIQIEINELLNVQYMEKRFGWSHGIGKYFTLFSLPGGGKGGLYLSLNGYLSFSSYRGFDQRPPVKYTLIPSAGLMAEWKYMGFSAGIDRYQFGTLYEENWKMDIKAFIRISKQTFFNDKKAILW